MFPSHCKTRNIRSTGCCDGIEVFQLLEIHACWADGLDEVHYYLCCPSLLLQCNTHPNRFKITNNSSTFCSNVFSVYWWWARLWLEWPQGHTKPENRGLSLKVRWISFGGKWMQDHQLCSYDNTIDCLWVISLVYFPDAEYILVWITTNWNVLFYMRMLF